MMYPAAPIADNNASTTRFCDFAADPTTVANWGHGNTIGFTAYGSSHNTGFASYKDNHIDALLLLYNDHIDSVVLDPTSGFNVPFFLNDKIANGCVSQRAYVNLGLDGNDGIYMSDRGFHSLRQSQEHGTRAESYLSWKIRPFFKTLNEGRKKYTVGAYDFKNGRAVWAVSTGSNTAHDTLLCLDLKGEEPITSENARWTIWKIAGDVSGGVTRYINELKYLRDENNVWRLYFGTTLGEVGYFADDTFTDFGDTYIASFQTAHNAHGSSTTNKNLGDVVITIEPSGTYRPTMKFYFDYGRKVSTDRRLELSPSVGASWGSGQWGIGEWASETTIWDYKVYGAGSGNTVGFGVTHSTGGEPFWISAIDYQVRITGEYEGGSSSGT